MAILGKRELQEALAQKENLLAQREAELGVLAKRVEELTKQASQQQTQLDSHQARERAIVDALTDAQQMAARIREEAERQKSQIVAGAYADRDAARKESDTVLQNAREQAAQIIARAESEANHCRAQADAYLRDIEKKAEELREHLRTTANEASKRAETFATLAGELMAEMPEIDLPADYETPAELMQSIYAIQGRDLPKSEEEKPEPPDVEAIISQAVTQAPAQDELEQEKDEEQEEPVVTVDAILAGTGTAAGQESGMPNDASDGLDAILDDILKDL